MDEIKQWETHRERMFRMLSNLKGEIHLRNIMNELEYTDKHAIIEDFNFISRNLKKDGKKLLVRPPICEACGYIFTLKSGSIKIPSKCPNCHEQRIDWPIIKIKNK